MKLASVLEVVKEPLAEPRLAFPEAAEYQVTTVESAHGIQLHDDMVFRVQIVWLVGIIRSIYMKIIPVPPFHPVRVWVGSLSPAHKEVFGAG